MTFKFNTPVCSGSAPGKGDTSYFFGLASSQAPKAVTATVSYSPGGSGTLSLGARAPQIRISPVLPKPKGR